MKNDTKSKSKKKLIYQLNNQDKNYSEISSIKEKNKSSNNNKKKPDVNKSFLSSKTVESKTSSSEETKKAEEHEEAKMSVNVFIDEIFVKLKNTDHNEICN